MTSPLDRQALVSELDRTRHVNRNAVRALREKLLRADALLCRYRATLEWYAEHAHYYPSQEAGHAYIALIDRDRGKRARAVLEGMQCHEQAIDDDTAMD